MKDLDLGPETRRILKRWREECAREGPDFHAPAVETLEVVSKAMHDLLMAWLDDSWCWPDASPARICGGPHVKVIYDSDKTIEVIEHVDHVGEMFPDVPYTVSRS